MEKIRVAWLAPFPTDGFRHEVPRRGSHPSHPATWLVNLACGLAARNDIDLHIATLSKEVHRDHDFIEDGVTYHLLHRSRLTKSLLTGYRFDRQRLQKFLSRTQPDVVHAHGTEDAYGYCAAKCGYPAVLSVQGIIAKLYHERKNSLDIPSLYYSLQRFFERQAVRNTQHFIAKTPFAADFVRTQNAGATIHHIANPVHERYFEVIRKPGEIPVILFIGYLTVAKGLLDLVAAFERVIKEYPRARLRIVGPNNTNFVAAVIKPKLAACGLSQKVDLLGFLRTESIAEELSKASMLVLPSHMDTSPNVVSEAMTAGVPVIGTDIGGIPDMINDGETGILVPVRNAIALARAICDLLGDPERADQLGAAARIKAMQLYHPPLVTQCIVDVYREVIYREVIKGPAD